MAKTDDATRSAPGSGSTPTLLYGKGDLFMDSGQLKLSIMLAVFVFVSAGFAFLHAFDLPTIIRGEYAPLATPEHLSMFSEIVHLKIRILFLGSALTIPIIIMNVTSRFWMLRFSFLLRGLLYLIQATIAYLTYVFLYTGYMREITMFHPLDSLPVCLGLAALMVYLAFRPRRRHVTL